MRFVKNYHKIPIPIVHTFIIPLLVMCVMAIGIIIVFFQMQFNLHRLLLMATHLCFDHPNTGECVEIQAPIPSAIHRLFQQFGWDTALWPKVLVTKVSLVYHYSKEFRYVQFRACCHWSQRRDRGHQDRDFCSWEVLGICQQYLLQFLGLNSN